MSNSRKSVDFDTKLFYKGRVYLKVSDVTKALGFQKQQDFINEYSQLIEKISGIQCISEADYNNLLSTNSKALSRQGQIEITRIETLRSRINSVLSFQPLKMLFARDYLNMMAARTGCRSSEEYIVTHEIPEEKKKVLQELIQSNEQKNSTYHDMVEYLQDKERFDMDIIKSYGLDVQFLTSIESDGKMSLDVYVVGKGVFYNITNFGDYALWNELCTNEEGDVMLPWCDYDSNTPEELMINLSQNNIERDFSKYNVADNMLWCIENLDVKALEDYEYSVFEYNDDTIDFCMPLELLVKMIRPDAVDIIYVDRIIDVETGLYLTEFDEGKVFAEEFDS